MNTAVRRCRPLPPGQRARVGDAAGGEGNAANFDDLHGLNCWIYLHNTTTKKYFSRFGSVASVLNLDRVRALCAVARSGSVAAAARVLHVTPSGVSQQLAKLEREVGVALLEPAGRGVRLTPAGELLARRGGELLARASGVEAEIAAMRSEVVGPLRFGAFVTASRLVLPSAVGTLLSRYPLHVTVTEAETEVTLESVARGRIDVGVVDSWESAPVDVPAHLESRLIHRDTADLALSVDHPCARDAEVRLSSLADMPWWPGVRHRIPRVAGWSPCVGRFRAARRFRGVGRLDTPRVRGGRTRGRAGSPAGNGPDARGGGAGGDRTAPAPRHLRGVAGRQRRPGRARGYRRGGGRVRA